jgi:CzcA family heavy metal efflux pump
MFRWIIGASLQYRYLVMAATAALFIFGFDRLQNLPLDVFPEFAPPRIEIQTEGPGMSVEEIEELLTIPLEEALRGLPELDVMRSKSVTGLSSINMIFKPGIDILTARESVQERLQAIAPKLPITNAAPVILQPQSSVSRVMQLGISSKTMSIGDLSMTAFWNIRFRLLQVPGIANVVLWGFRNQQLVILMDPQKMAAHGVAVQEVRNAAAGTLNVGLLKYNASAKGSVDGFIETPNQRFYIHHKMPIAKPEELREVVIKFTADGSPVRFKDVARVEWNHDPQIGDAVINDGEGILVVLQKFPWANTLDVTRGVEKAIAEIKPGLPGVEIDTTIFRPASFVEQSLANLSHAMVVGAALVVLVLALFLFEWRVVVISLVAIPLSLVAAGLVLYWQGATINTMVLAGFFVGLGSLVDDAIIDVENILRRLRQNDELPPDERQTRPRIILEASLEVRRAIIYATLIIVLSVVPVFFMQGVSGAFFIPLVFAYMLALIASMIVALIVTPALALVLLGNAPLHHSEPKFTIWLKTRYDVALTRTIAQPMSGLAITAMITLVAIAIWPTLGQSLMPAFKERGFLALWTMKPSIGRAAAVRSNLQASRDFMKVPGMRPMFGSHIGRSLTGPEVVSMNYTEHWIGMEENAPYEETYAKAEAMLDQYTGVQRELHTFVRERIRDVITGASQAIVIRVYGPDLPTLRSKAEEIRRAIADVDGLKSPRVGLQTENPHIQIRVRIDDARKHGLKPGDVRREAAVILAGSDVTDVFQEGKVFGVFVWSVPEVRQSVGHVRDIMIDKPDGGHVRLGDVADVTIEPTPNDILRDNYSRRIDVTGNVADGADLSVIAAEIQKRLHEVDFPLEYRAEVLGEFAERQANENSMRWIIVAVAIGILLLLQASFQSWRLAILTYCALPAALVGGVFAALWGGGVVSLGSLVGLLTVLGIAARNGILLIHHYQHLEREEGEPFGLNLILRGARERLSPILMTSLCTGLALLPIAFSGELPGHEIEHPMALVIIGGLFTSTLLNLFVVPVLYLWFGGTGRTTATPALPPSTASITVAS